MSNYVLSYGQNGRAEYSSIAAAFYAYLILTTHPRYAGEAGILSLVTGMFYLLTTGGIKRIG